MIKRTFYKDKWNDNKIWEVVEMKGGFYLRQYIKGIKHGRGIRTTKKFIKNLGILAYEKAEVKELEKTEHMFSLEDKQITI